ncbi:putative ABC transport system permease protein [Clostridium acetobutylicum]|uniref:Predicted permease n=1 Tax=Clostridium acetobutylicum (strain ATCC 824 / DSM 792 / JCM 1419 / IAM 19013 / LMG 5710 / NBRC 13948 / NRRL B-527 / VKM B-1787 / 2291 / W) TaxID=272562 RepID=Q97IX1_CLOAB|nr:MULTISPECIES: ABC transporter permease [Clostridium]AAK79486.1 Predicted permease [Clostridium acetobutylicum ATCC 824]ADZ20571.1 permease [Clostridium acetobutylicum EA 2018]AEI34121.1 permease [Clostridium acetobutylicum DSM 1731]AWV81269.1 ABC transporter permease [Clostridium acetobutylicum]MBC2392903.1 ABC transporter permease [Clostridium acetobutylicum]
MTLYSLVLKNIKGNLNKFIMYYLSNAFVVMVFFIFANFILNPNVKSIKTMGQMGAVTTEIMYGCEIVILIFTLVFTNYSTSSFLKSREKEFGLLSMFGLTKSEIRRYVMAENLIVAMLSILTGVLLGMLFSKLFFMAVSVILLLNSELPIVLSFKAVGITILCFLILFQGTEFFVSYKIKSNNIIELLKGERKAKPVPKFSKKKAILAIILILSGYVMALVSYQMIIVTMFIILGVTIAGTYLLYSQFSVYLTNKLQNNKRVFYRGTNMITLAQIIYKLRDNAKILFTVSILSAVTLTASASVYSFQKTIEKEMLLNYPQDIGFIENGLSSHEIISPAKVEKQLKNSGNKVENKNKIILIKANSDDVFKTEVSRYGNKNKKDFYIMKNSDYNKLAGEENKDLIDVKTNEAVVRSYNFDGKENEKTFEDNSFLSLKIYGKNIKYKLKKEIGGGIINEDLLSTNTIIINDGDFRALKDKLNNDKLCVYYGYNIKDWRKSEKVIKSLKAQVPKEMRERFTERITNFSTSMKSMAIFFFIGTFISVLFFIATGSILYFKMFSEIQKDRGEFIALKKMGVSIEEVGKILSRQCFIMFFLPFIIAFLHTFFAIKALSNILGTSLNNYLMLIVGIYLLLQIIYFNFARYMYTRQINSWT